MADVSAPLRGIMVMAVRSSATVTAADTAEVGTTAAVGKRWGASAPFFIEMYFFSDFPIDSSKCAAQRGSVEPTVD